MTTPSAQEQILLDTHPQKSDLFLSIYEPNLAMICQVTGSYDTTNQTIDYYNPVSGSTANILDYQWYVVLVGTSANDDSLGRTWLRTATAATLRFVESDHIDWASATYLTILKYTEIIPIYPRIIQNPSNEEDVIFYKYFDVAYTNQNEILGTFVNMGSQFAGFLENGTGTCYWTASGSSNLLGETLSYAWTFEGATVTGSTAHTPGYQQYGYAMFFMNQKALDSLNSTQGFEVGVGPSVVVVDSGIAKNVTSGTLTEDIYAFVYAQKGLMAGIGSQEQQDHQDPEVMVMR